MKTWLHQDLWRTGARMAGLAHPYVIRLDVADHDERSGLPGDILSLLELAFVEVGT